MFEDKKIESLIENYNLQKQIDVEAGWESLNKRIVAERRRRIVFSFARNAAAVLLPLFLIYQYAIVPMFSDINGDGDGQMITLVAAPGMIINTTLPDGSEVWINSQSSLTYPQSFSKKERNVSLDGEAYFKVVSDKKHRFNVNLTNQLTVSAFGTEFNINSFSKDDINEITLAKGNIEVILKNQDKSLFLNVDEKAVFDNQLNTIEVTQTDTYVNTAWKDGKMVFRRAKLDEVAKRLEKKFGVVINLKDEALNDYEYTATFTDEPLEDILELLSMSAPLEYSIKKQKQLEDSGYSNKEVEITLKR